MTELLVILGCAVGFAVMGLLTRGMQHHEHEHEQAGPAPEDPTDPCGGCSLHCETTEVRDA